MVIVADHLRERVLPPAGLEDAFAEIAAGRMVIVLDQDGLRARGVLVVAAEHATDRHIAFMTRQAGGFLCLALTPERCDELGLTSMAGRHAAADDTRFTVTIEAREGVTTGISAADQARTMRTAADPSRGRDDLIVPGHVRPVRTRAWGVLDRAEGPEAAVELARLAGAWPAAAWCEIMDEDGRTANLDALAAFADRHDLPVVAMSALADHRRRRARLVERVHDTPVHTRFGTFRQVTYRGVSDGQEHVALVKGVARGATGLPAWIQRPWSLTDFLHVSRRGEAAFEDALRRIDAEGRGVVLHLARDRGDERAFPEADAAALPDRAIAAAILADLGVRSPRILDDGGEPGVRP